MWFPILIEVENGAFNSWKIGDILLKCVEFDLNFQGEGHTFANCLFYILIISRKSFSFQFLSCGIRMFFAILPGVEDGRFTSWKVGDIPLKNVYFES